MRVRGRERVPCGRETHLERTHFVGDERDGVREFGPRDTSVALQQARVHSRES